MGIDRREFQRLKLVKPILALMDGESALILDIGVAGAFLEHYGVATPGDPLVLAFRWQGQDVQYRCEIARSTIVRNPGGDGRSVVSHSGVHFIEPLGEAGELLEEMIATYVGRVLAAQKANASGESRGIDGDATLAQIGEAHRSRSRGFISFRLKGGSWWRVPTDSPNQPTDGFTVAAYEDDEELETLCRTYEQADEEGQRLIRLVAELSVMANRR